MLQNIPLGLASFAISTLLYLIILVISFFSLYKLRKGKLFLLLIASTLAWSFILTLSQIGGSIAFEFIFIAEVLRYFVWFYLIQQVSGLYLDKPFRSRNINILSPLFTVLVLSLALISIILYSLSGYLFSFTPSIMPEIIWMIIFSILGLILIENLIRNTPDEHKDSIIYLAISSGAIFIYDLFVFSNSLLIGTIQYDYWSARGIINVLVIPFLILAAVRNPSLAPRLHISREFVLHSATFIGVGFYLILMALTGYIIKQESGQWGGILQASFLFVAIVLLISLFFSNFIKIKIKRFIAKSFRNKYDYRSEWNRFSNTLLAHSTDTSIFKRSIIAVSNIVDSTGGALWLFQHQYYRCMAGWKITTENLPPLSSQDHLIKYLLDKRSIITISEYDHDNVHSENDWFKKDNDDWLIIPLWNAEVLFGFIHLKASESPFTLDFEDYELLETVAHHISLSLSLNESVSALQQAEKFKQINQMTAFLTHDLKTLLSQLFLLVENGKVHKDNPAFIDDMLDTLDHVSQKMQRLVNQLKDPSEKASDRSISVLQILNEIVTDYKLSTVQPQIVCDKDIDFQILATKNELSSALKHIIQNAVDAVGIDGVVKIELASNNSDQLSIKIIDNGKGMSQEFIANRLFQPFESTKGVSGMGIGVYQSREYIRSLGGEIQVSSQPGVGTTFTITLPLSK